MLDRAAAHLDAGEFEAAETLCRAALAARPGDAAALQCLGLVADRRGDHAAAESFFRQALATNPRDALNFANLAGALRAQGKPREAIDAYRQALLLQPRHPLLHFLIAGVLREAGLHDDALAHYERATASQPTFAEAHFQRGNLLAARARPAAAADAYRAAIAADATHAGAHYNLGNELARQGRMAEALQAYRDALALAPDWSMAHSNLITAMQYLPAVDDAALFAESRRYAERREALLAAIPPTHRAPRAAGERLRVGYLSPDFRAHSVAYFIEPILTHHDRAHFEVTCYYNNTIEDAVSRRLQRLADRWVPCAHLDDDALCARIIDDGIDILVDLAGHTAHHRLDVFARKPAPVQVSYLGYPGTSGLSTMDARFTDRRADPDGDAWYSERLLRLPRSFLCYRPPDDAPAVSTPPSARNGHVTFGSFNALQKITPEVAALWTRLLNAVPDARLVLKAVGLDIPEIRARYLALFRDHGLDEDRLSLLGPDRDVSAHLARYADVDIGLDPFPYNGTTTTCEALWMGIPVITLRGGRHAASVGASLLGTLLLDNLIADDENAYIEIARNLASDAARLRNLRVGLRERMQASAVRDEMGVTREIEAAYRELHDRQRQVEAR